MKDESSQKSTNLSHVSVQVPLAVAQTYDYRVPPDMGVAIGDIVRVPLGNRECDAVVWGLASTPPRIKLKTLIRRYDIPPLAQDMRDFIDRMADYVMAPRGLVLRLAMRVPKAFLPPRAQLVCRLNDTKADLAPLKMTAARRRVFACFDAPDIELSPTVLAGRAGVSIAVIKKLIALGYLVVREIVQEAVFAHPHYNRDSVMLSGAQKTIARDFIEAVERQKFAVHVLDGVTGSGKTEVYFEAIAAALAAQKQVLVLLPEIALTAQFLERFVERFGHRPALWHNALSDTLRRLHWRGVARGDVRIVVGARSALFLPWRALGLIVVDEEHDTSFKQEEGVVYNARDMAVLRVQCADCPIILSSATPSFETIANAQRGRYVRHNLPDRYGGALMPQIMLINMRAHPPPRGSWLAPPLVNSLAQALARGAQALLFLNRRGFAPLVLCRGCGHRYMCATCDAWMVSHMARKRLICHHCGADTPMPVRCDKCDGDDTLVACGPGIERIYEEVCRHFPTMRTRLLSSDHAGGVEQMAELLADIAAGEVDIIIGTQIVAKGHHFPNLGFVGVVDADLGLDNGDLRASERTYQLLSQVAGRAGRASVSGQVMIQTYMDTHPVMQALARMGDADNIAARDAFIACELAARKTATMPPYGRLAALIISGDDSNRTVDFMRKFKASMPHHAGIQVFGPAPAPIAKLRNRYRYRFLLKAATDAPSHAFLRHWLNLVRPPARIKIAIDIDPYSFM